jgi:hypothetical protein
MAYAVCWRSGQIEIFATVPDGTIPIARGRRRDLEKEMLGAARHAYDGKTLLLPGLPEADDDFQGLDAVKAFINWRRPSFARRNLKAAFES